MVFGLLTLTKPTDGCWGGGGAFETMYEHSGSGDSYSSKLQYSLYVAGHAAIFYSQDGTAV